MDDDKDIQLLQVFICRDFQLEKNDAYTGSAILSNYHAPGFPHNFGKLFVITCWRKDARFHKEVIEYITDYGETVRSPHMDIEPVTDTVLFRWHKHQFPRSLVIKQPTILTIRIILDWKTLHETYIMIEKGSS